MADSHNDLARAASPGRDEFIELVSSGRARGGGRVAVPVGVALLDDQLTPVLAYRRLVAPDEREAPSFLFESVEGGERQGRHSILGAQPVVHVVARGRTVTVEDHRGVAPVVVESAEDNPFEVLRRLGGSVRLCPSGTARLPRCFLGGWVGFAAYDTVRYAEPGKLPESAAPSDDRGLPDLHFAWYDGVVVFDHVDKLVHAVVLAEVGPDDDAGAAYDAAIARLSRRIAALRTHSEPMSGGLVRDLAASPRPLASNMTRDQHAAMLARAAEYIRAGDVFQVVLGQRFERASAADPFDVYRALRVVNPSPYMVYMQARGCILVASSPEILCRVRRGADGRFTVTNRPLAGTRRRGATPDEDRALEADLLADPKERAEHVMLVDLGRNDLGVVCEPGAIRLEEVMAIERYSHVMHISSTVTGRLRDGLDCWDALRATLPVGTISGAPKIRAMQIIDELEPVRRGPYGGGFGAVGADGQMDIALALRTMVVPVSLRDRAAGTWTYHLQASGGIVADSLPEAEFQETVNKAAALARAIEVAERAFGVTGGA
ncbi:MAG: anthranilate synthase component I [Phycisphaerales bacterium]